MQEFIDIENILMNTPCDDFISMLLKDSSNDPISVQIEDSKLYEPLIPCDNIINLDNSPYLFDKQKEKQEEEDINDNIIKSNTSVHDFMVSNKTNKRPKIKNQPLKKKRKLTPVSIQKLVQPLSKEQLESVILKLVEQVPTIEDCVRSNLPTFDVTTKIQELQKLKQKVFQAFPHTRYGSSYDHYSFTRVKTAQSAFITAARKPITVLSTAKQWSVLLEYLLAIIEEAAELPDWDVLSDRKAKQNLFKTFAKNLLKVLQHLETSEIVLNYEQIHNICKVHNTNAHGSPFNDCISYLDNK